jgi:ABC-2 type transport system ATP-binding protein
MTNTDVITVRGLGKSYGSRTVLEDLNLDVRAGEVVGLIGANGAGKTTTVECIQGLRRPDRGTIRVLGIDPLAHPERLRPLLGSQLQNSALPDRLRVQEAVTLFSRRDARDGTQLLAEFGLAERGRSAFASLSGGEQQRLFLVLALVNRPQLLILDELTQGLDPAARRTVWLAVDRLRDAGTTVLLVTHELDEAEALCDRVVVMRAGRVLDAGRPAELIDRHGRQTVISFELWPGGSAEELFAQLRRLDGVQRVERNGQQVSVYGGRRAIASVGAALVRADRVPADLCVRMPDLEGALLELLEGETADPPPEQTANAPMAGLLA